MIQTLFTSLLAVAVAFADDAAPPAPPATETAAAKPPKPIIGPTASLGHTLARGKPSPYAIGVQTIIPYRHLRFAAEGFVASPTTAWTPAVGGDVGVGLMDKKGLGGAVAFYGRYVLPGDEVEAATIVGPGVMMLAKVAPTVVLVTPLVFWVDTKTGDVTPTLAVKAVLGVPWAK